MQLISYSIILLCTLETLVEFWEVFARVLTLAASYALKTYNLMQVRSIAIYLACSCTFTLWKMSHSKWPSSQADNRRSGIISFHTGYSVFTWNIHV